MALDFCFILDDETHLHLQAFLARAGYQAGNISISHPDIIFATQDKILEAVAQADHGSTCCFVVDKGAVCEHDLPELKAIVASMFTAGKIVYVELLDLNQPEEQIVEKLVKLRDESAFAQHFLDETTD